MSVYFTDVVEITSVAYDSEKKTQTLGTPFEVKGYWEMDSSIKYYDGLPVVPDEWVFFPEDTNVKKGDLLRLIKKGPVDVSSNPDYTEKRVAKRVNLEVSLGPIHFEVQI